MFYVKSFIYSVFDAYFGFLVPFSLHKFKLFFLKLRFKIINNYLDCLRQMKVC